MNPTPDRADLNAREKLRRPRTPEEACAALQRIIDGKGRICIPPQIDDDDLVLHDVIEEWERLRAPPERPEAPVQERETGSDALPAEVEAELRAEPCCTRCKRAGLTECTCPIAKPLPYGPVDPVCRWPVPMKQREWDNLRAWCDRIPDKLLAGQVRAQVSMLATAEYEVATLRRAARAPSASIGERGGAHCGAATCDGSCAGPEPFDTCGVCKRPTCASITDTASGITRCVPCDRATWERSPRAGTGAALDGAAYKDLAQACANEAKRVRDDAHRQSAIGPAYFAAAMETHDRARRFDRLAEQMRDRVASPPPRSSGTP